MTRTVALLALCALAGACAGAEPDVMDRETFVATYIDLRSQMLTGSLDSAARTTILETHGTTEEELRAYIRHHSNDPEALADTWRAVMDSVAARDAERAARDSAAAEPDTL